VTTSPSVILPSLCSSLLKLIVRLPAKVMPPAFRQIIATEGSSCSIHSEDATGAARLAFKVNGGVDYVEYKVDSGLLVGRVIGSPAAADLAACEDACTPKGNCEGVLYDNSTCSLITSDLDPDYTGFCPCDWNQAQEFCSLSGILCVTCVTCVTGVPSLTNTWSRCCHPSQHCGGVSASFHGCHLHFEIQSHSAVEELLNPGSVVVELPDV